MINLILFYILIPILVISYACNCGKDDSIYVEEFEEYLERAESGDVEAMFNVSKCYENAEGTERNVKEGFKWLRMAAEKGNGEAMCSLAKYYEYSGNGGSELGCAKAVEWYKKSAETGNPDGFYGLAVCYAEGIGVEKDLEKAFSYYEEASCRNNVDATYAIAECYRKGLGVESDIVAAYYWYCMAADKGNSKAMRALGKYYYSGVVIEVDKEEAFKWFHSSALHGDIAGMRDEAYCYLYGEGVERDPVTAANKIMNTYRLKSLTGAKDTGDFIKHFEALAEKGDSEAMYCLGILYEEYIERISWYTKAINKDGNTDAMCGLARCYLIGDCVKQDYAEALKLYREAADKGNIQAKTELGGCYYAGLGVKQDFNKAVQLWKEAVEYKNIDAMYGLAFCYKSGNGVEKNAEKSRLWFAAAGEEGHIFPMPVIEDEIDKVIKNAIKGDAESMLYYGYFKENGVGMVKYPKLAEKWYSRAVKKGNVDAMSLLSSYEFKKGNNKEAISLCTRAAEQGNILGMIRLGAYYESSDGNDIKKAFEYYKKAADAGSSKGMVLLGCLYMRGDGVEVDVDKANALFEKSADLDDPLAALFISASYYNGIGKEKDEDKAYKYLKKSAIMGNKDAMKYLKNWDNRNDIKQ